MNKKKILYVEDDLSLIEGLKYTLEKNGFLVDNARTVMEAYQFFRAGQYDLLLRMSCCRTGQAMISVRK